VYPAIIIQYCIFQRHHCFITAFTACLLNFLTKNWKIKKTYVFCSTLIWTSGSKVLNSINRAFCALFKLVDSINIGPLVSALFYQSWWRPAVQWNVAPPVGRVQPVNQSTSVVSRCSHRHQLAVVVSTVKCSVCQWSVLEIWRATRTGTGSISRIESLYWDYKC